MCLHRDKVDFFCILCIGPIRFFVAVGCDKSDCIVLAVNKLVYVNREFIVLNQFHTSRYLLAQLRLNTIIMTSVINNRIQKCCNLLQ